MDYSLFIYREENILVEEWYVKSERRWIFVYVEIKCLFQYLVISGVAAEPSVCLWVRYSSPPANAYALTLVQYQNIRIYIKRWYDFVIVIFFSLLSHQPNVYIIVFFSSLTRLSLRRALIISSISIYHSRAIPHDTVEEEKKNRGKYISIIVLKNLFIKELKYIFLLMHI